MKNRYRVILIYLFCMALISCESPNELNFKITVYDESQNPLSDVTARVNGIPLDGVSDSSGELISSVKIKPADFLHFSTFKKGYETAEKKIRMEINKSLYASTFLMKKTGYRINLTLRARDEEGNISPLTNADLFVAGEKKGSTGFDGKFLLFINDLGKKNIDLFVNHPSFVETFEQNIPLNIEQSSYDKEIILDVYPARNFYFRFRNNKAEPVERQKIIISDKELFTDEEGKAETSIPIKSGEKIEIQFPDSSICMPNSRTISIEKDKADYDFSFTQGEPVSVSLSVSNYETGAPVDGIEIKIVNNQRTIGFTNENGELEKSVLCLWGTLPDVLNIEMNKRGFLPTTGKLVNAGEFSYRGAFSVRRALLLSLDVAYGTNNGNDRIPVSGAVVNVIGNSGVIEAETDKNGKFEKILPEEGFYTIKVYDRKTSQQYEEVINIGEEKTGVLSITFSAESADLRIVALDSENESEINGIFRLLDSNGEIQHTGVLNEKKPSQVKTGSYILIIDSEEYSNYQQFVDISGDRVIEVKLYRDYIKKGRILINNDEAKKALSEFNKVTENNAEYPKAQYFMAICHLKMSEETVVEEDRKTHEKAAQRHIQNAITHDNEQNPKYYLILSRCHIKKGYYPDALESLKAAKSNLKKIPVKSNEAMNSQDGYRAQIILWQAWCHASMSSKDIAKVKDWEKASKFYQEYESVCNDNQKVARDEMINSLATDVKTLIEKVKQEMDEQKINEQDMDEET